MASGIGETLSVARRQRGVTLSDAAAETRIREAYLAALEEEEFAALGGDVYVKGFLRSYARFLGLDPEPLLEEYRAHHQRREDNAAPATRPLASPASDRPPFVGLLGVAALVLLGVLLVIGIWPDGDPTDEQGAVAPRPVEEATEEVLGERRGGPERENAAAGSAPTAQPTPTPTPTPTPVGGPDLSEQVELTFNVVGGESWVDVEVDGQSVMSTVQPDGFSETWSGSDVSLIIGNAGAASITVNGVDLGDLGDAGDVVAVECAVGAESCSVEERN